MEFVAHRIHNVRIIIHHPNKKKHHQYLDQEATKSTQPQENKNQRYQTILISSSIH